jgi:hypothetical protein
MPDPAAPRLDFYTYIHKSLRRQLFAVLTSAAAADVSDDGALATLSADLARLLANLRAHGRHEEAFLHPVLARHLPEAAARLGGAHAAHEAELDELARAFDAAKGTRSPEAGAAFTRALGRFVGHYLLHLADEEDLNPEIAARVPREELAAAMAAFQASRTPEEAGRDLELMLPALNRQDRVAVLGRLQATAPPAFIFVMDIARRVLDPMTLLTLETDLHVESTG